MVAMLTVNCSTLSGSEPGFCRNVTSSELSLHREFLCSIVLITSTT